MIVTDKKYYLDKGLKGKMDLMCQRCSGKRKLDNWVIIDGDEGYGKTTISVELAYYVAQKLGRTFDVNNIFFIPEDFINFVKSTEKQVIILDEAVLVALASEWQNKIQKALMKLAMVCRKKQHFIFLNIPKFFKLNEYLLIDRSIALIHVYARHELEQGRFVYFNKVKKELLYYAFRRSKRRDYKKFYKLRGTFGDDLDKIIDIDAYDTKKDKAIESVDINKQSDKDIKLEMVKGFIQFCKEKNIITTDKEIIATFNIPQRTLTRYKGVIKG